MLSGSAHGDGACCVFLRCAGRAFSNCGARSGLGPMYLSEGLRLRVLVDSLFGVLDEFHSLFSFPLGFLPSISTAQARDAFHPRFLLLPAATSFSQCYDAAEPLIPSTSSASPPEPQFSYSSFLAAWIAAAP